MNEPETANNPEEGPSLFSPLLVNTGGDEAQDELATQDSLSPANGEMISFVIGDHSSRSNHNRGSAAAGNDSPSQMDHESLYSGMSVLSTGHNSDLFSAANSEAFSIDIDAAMAYVSDANSCFSQEQPSLISALSVSEASNIVERHIAAHPIETPEDFHYIADLLRNFENENDLRRIAEILRGQRSLPKTIIQQSPPPQSSPPPVSSSRNIVVIKKDRDAPNTSTASTGVTREETKEPSVENEPQPQPQLSHDDHDNDEEKVEQASLSRSGSSSDLSSSSSSTSAKRRDKERKRERKREKKEKKKRKKELEQSESESTDPIQNKTKEQSTLPETDHSDEFSSDKAVPATPKRDPDGAAAKQTDASEPKTVTITMPPAEQAPDEASPTIPTDQGDTTTTSATRQKPTRERQSSLDCNSDHIRASTNAFVVPQAPGESAPLRDPPEQFFGASSSDSEEPLSDSSETNTNSTADHELINMALGQFSEPSSHQSVRKSVGSTFSAATSRSNSRGNSMNQLRQSTSSVPPSELNASLLLGRQSFRSSVNRRRSSSRRARVISTRHLVEESARAVTRAASTNYIHAGAKRGLPGGEEATGKEQAIEAELAVKPRLLCLHGWRSNAEITRLQLDNLGLQDFFDPVIIEGPHISNKPGDETVSLLSHGPYYSWVNNSELLPCELLQSLKVVMLHLLSESQYLDTHNEDKEDTDSTPCYDAVFGFSQGATLVTLLSYEFVRNKVLRELNLAPLRRLPWKFVISACAADIEMTKELLPAYLKPDYSEPIQIPSVHLIGLADSLRGTSETMLKEHFSQQLAYPIYLDGGHGIPASTIKSREEIIHWFLLKVMVPDFEIATLTPEMSPETVSMLHIIDEIDKAQRLQLQRSKALTEVDVGKLFLGTHGQYIITSIKSSHSNLIEMLEEADHNHVAFYAPNSKQLTYGDLLRFIRGDGDLRRAGAQEGFTGKSRIHLLYPCIYIKNLSFILFPVDSRICGAVWHFKCYRVHSASSPVHSCSFGPKL